jgi:Mannitol repressor
MTKDKRPYSDSFHFREVSKMAVSLDHESDRAVALILASWVDDALTEMTKRSLVQDERVIQDMLSHIGPLGTFSSRIGLAYLIGRISRPVYENLETIRKIRNDFAHTRDNLTFASQSINDRCKNLFLRGFKGCEIDPVYSPRSAYVATGIALLGFLIEFVSSPTMSADRIEDCFPNFMESMARDTPAMIAKFAEQSVGQRAADNTNSNG